MIDRMINFSCLALELPMAGVILPRAKLQEALQTARTKRQKLNNMRIVLLNAMETDQTTGLAGSSSSYGSSIQELIKAQLLSGQTNLVSTTTMPIHSEMEEDSYGELPEMDIDAYPIDDGDDQPTLQPEEGGEHTIESSNIPDVLIEEKSPERTVVEYDTFVRDMKTTIENRLVEEGERSVSWNAYTKSNNRHLAANNFFHLLTAATNQDLAVYQANAYGDIAVSTM